MPNNPLDQQAVEEFRRLRPDWANAPDEDVYKVLNLPYERPSDFQRGLSNYIPQTKELIGAVEALTGEGLRRALGEGSVGNYLRENGLKRMEEAKAEAKPMPEDSLTDAWKRGGLSSVLANWLPYQVGQGVGNLAEMGAAVGAGALAGSAAGPEGTAAGGLMGIVGKKVLRKELVEAAEKIALTKGEKAASKFINREVGKNLGLAMDASFHGFGETGQNAIDEGGGIDKVDFNRLVPAAAAHAGLEFVGDKMLGHAFKGEGEPIMTIGKNGMKAIPANMAKEVAVLGAKEAPVEVGQTALERYAAGQDLTNEDAQKDYIDAAGAAFGMGAGTGAVGGVRQSFRKSKDATVLPGSVSAGEAAGKAAANLVDSAIDAYHNWTKPDNTDADWHLLNRPIERSAPDANAAADERNAAAMRYAQKIFNNDATSPQEKELAAKFMSEVKGAENPVAVDNSVAEFRDGIVKERKYNDTMGSFVQGWQDFTDASGVTRRANAQNPIDQRAELGEQKPQKSGGPQGAEHAAKVAQLWLKNNAAITGAFNGLDVNDPRVRNGAQAVFDWVGNGMPNFDRVSHALHQMWGEKAGEMVRSAYQYRVAEGLQHKNEAMGKQVEESAKVLDSMGKFSKNRVQTLLSFMRPTVKDAMLNDPLMTDRVKKLDGLLHAFARGKKVDIEHVRKTIDHLFGQNADEVMALYEPKKEEYLNYEPHAQQESDDEENPSEPDTFNSGIQEVKGPQVEGIYHAKHQKLELLNKKHEIIGQGLIPKVQGMWSRLKQDHEHSPDLRAKEDELIRMMFEGTNVEHRMKDEQDRGAMLRYIDRTFKAIDSVEPSEHEGVDLSEDDVKRMSDTKGGVEQGRLLLEKGDGSEFTVSVGNVIKVMREKRNQGAFDERGSSAKKNAGAEDKRMLTAGISSIINSGEFTGRVGYTNDEGKTVWLKNASQLPSNLFDPYTKQSAKSMKEGEAAERRDEKPSNTPYAETVAEKRQVLEDKAQELREQAKAFAQDGEADKANKLLGFAKVLEEAVNKGAPAINKMYRELRGAEMQKESPKQTASETRVVQELRGQEFKTDENGEEVVQTNVREHVYSDTPTEIEEMGKTTDDKSLPKEGEFMEGDRGEGFDRDMVGQGVPERDISRATTKEQKRWLKAQLTKGVPSFVASIKSASPEQQFRVREALRNLIKSGKLGDLQARAEQAAMMLRGRDVAETSQQEQRAANAQETSADHMTEEDKQALRDRLTQVLGDRIKAAFAKHIDGNLSGEHIDLGKKDVQNIIRIAVNAITPSGVLDHEMAHELMVILRRAGANDMVNALERAAMTPMVQNRMKRELVGHDAAIEQLSDPQEAVAYMFQFWQAGKVQLGEKTETIFQKVAKALKHFLGIVSEEVRSLDEAKQIFEAFNEGQFANKNAELAAKAFNDLMVEARATAATQFFDKFKNSEVMKNAVFTAGNVLRDTKAPSLVKLAEMFHQAVGDKTEGQDLYRAVAQQRGVFLNMLHRDVFSTLEKEDLPVVLKHLQSDTPLSQIKDPVHKEAVKAVHAYLDKMFQYMQSKGMKTWNAETHEWEPVRKRDWFFPRVWDANIIAENPQAFIDKLKAHHMQNLEMIAKESGVSPDEVAEAIATRLMNTNGAEVSETGSDLGITPFAQSVNRRTLGWIDGKHFTEFMNQDLVNVLSSYTMQTIKRGEYTSRFGVDGSKLQRMVQEGFAYKALDGDQKKVDAVMKQLDRETDAWNALSKDDKLTTPKPTVYTTLEKHVSSEKFNEAAEFIKAPKRAVMALEGTLGREIDNNLRKILSGVTTYQNLRLLPFSLLSSFVDPMGIVVRGGTFSEAYNAFVRGVKEVARLNKGDKDLAAQVAEKIGIIDASAQLESLGQTYSSLFMFGKMKNVNDSFFRLIGMEAWNKAMRVAATGSAMGFIERHLNNPNEHSERYLQEELGLDPKGNYLKDGKLDTDNEAVQHAIMKWVDGAILRPNASQRPIVASDPHYALFYHLKQFSYSFHKTIIERTMNELAHGNLTPAMSIFLGYIPLAIAGDVIRAVLSPGDEPAWMKKGIGGAIEHGWERSGFGGVPQLYMDDMPVIGRGNIPNLFGPAVNQVVGILATPFSPYHTLGNEFLGALPGGGVLRKLSPAPHDPDATPSGLSATLGVADDFIPLLQHAARRG